MCTALHRAVEDGHVAVAEMLLKAGADVTLVDTEGRTAVDVVIEEDMDASALAMLS